MSPNIMTVGIQYGVCGEFGRIGFLVVCFLSTTDPNPRKIIYCRKKWPKRHFLTYFFLGLGWPWVGEFVGFIIMFIMFSKRAEVGKTEDTLILTYKYSIYRDTLMTRNIMTIFIQH